MNTNTEGLSSNGVTPPDRWLTVPNALCLTRLFGSFALLPLAVYDQSLSFLILFVALSATDWVDGKIARWLNQRSRIGPKLDTAADVTMYAAVLFGTVWLFHRTLLNESLLIGAAVVSYCASGVASLLKFKRWPSYHTRAAKLSWGITLLAVIALFLEWSVWPLRIAAFAVTVTNLEAMLITLALGERRDDVPTVFHVLEAGETSD